MSRKSRHAAAGRDDFSHERPHDPRHDSRHEEPAAPRPASMRTQLRLHDVMLKKSLGQNFLDDPNLAQKIVRAADVQPGQKVLEIGPGSGALTDKLLAAGARVLAVELDRRLIPLLNANFAADPRLQVVHGDILRMPRETLERFADGDKVKVVANLPYYNASQILFRLAEWRGMLSMAVLTLQKELVERMSASPGVKDYGILAVRMQAVADVRALFMLPSSVFFPQPRVDSQAVRLDYSLGRVPEDLDEKAFAKCVKAAFAARRKMLSNTLGNLYGAENARRAMTECDIDPTLRAERLTVENYFCLTRKLGPQKHERRAAAD
ncbi:MAG: ribosomal RNA small subunit methyltransferase A [Deltaproteobacteria bacterium]|nr:ribosomal RNA small subunit methyltransferase A [Deltaproteobacteria bacterium]MCB9478094.1 ribosomal RNA small subunit methyltransferase A [Deltaproteobacteria bacterium]MCB9487590.1 ribosomal RNA small subunit methyltransferase A [Deltaproteobacteria bacterium]